MEALEFLESKGIFNHARLQDVNNENSYEVEELLEEFADIKLNMRGVGIELKGDEQRFSTDAINLVDSNNDSYVLDKGKLYKLQNVSKYILVQ